jgi:hypothetical protein
MLLEVGYALIKSTLTLTVLDFSGYKILGARPACPGHRREAEEGHGTQGSPGRRKEIRAHTGLYFGESGFRVLVRNVHREQEEAEA